jgi:hypothetical protein
MKLNRTTTAIAALFLWTTVHAATITVNNTNDNGTGSLRAALAVAAGGDTIDATGISGTITLTSGQLAMTTGLTILGPGPANLAINGNSTSRVFHVSNAVNALIAGLSITNGAVSGSFPGNEGGGIWNDHSVLTLSNCSITGNSGGNGNGAGIYSDGSSGYAQFSIIASTVSGNTGWGGAGIYNYAYQGTSYVSVIACTISGNIASGPGVVGGGVWNNGNSGFASLAVSLSTFSGNSAPQSGGGIYNGGAFGGASLSVLDSTFNGNSASNGGAIFNAGNGGTATVSIADTILKTGGLGANILNNVGTVTSVGYNLSSDNGGGALTKATDQLNTDPMLGPLANNGGPTFTHAPLAGSLAIDKGKSFGSTTDQRGFPRTVDDPCIANASGGDGSDIGALETQTVCPNLQITAITRETNNIRIIWTTYAGKTNALQATAGAGNGSYQTNGFANLFIVTNTVGTMTNYLDVGGATNRPARYYRVRLLP